MTTEPQAPRPFLPAEAWRKARNPDLPAGVIEVRDRDGRRWRYPLVEFDVEDPS